MDVQGRQFSEFLPHRRERVFFLASAGEDPADILLVDEANPEFSDTRLETHAHGFYWTEGTRGLGWGRDCVPTLKNGSTLRDSVTTGDLAHERRNRHARHSRCRTSTRVAVGLDKARRNGSATVAAMVADRQRCNDAGCRMDWPTAAEPGQLRHVERRRFRR